MNAFDVEYASMCESAGHRLRLVSCPNLRELGGYLTPGGPTRLHSFLRCGSTRTILPDDLERLHDLGVRHVLDLRSRGESPEHTCLFARQSWVRWENVPLFDYDMSAPSMLPVRDAGGYLTSGYLRMLSNGVALRRVFSFFSTADDEECVLFHCAAGMDRTGVVSMLLLGLADAMRAEIIADYAYSFAPAEQVDAAVATGELHADADPRSESFILDTRIAAIATVYDTIVEHYGSVRGLLAQAGIPTWQLDAVRKRLID